MSKKVYVSSPNRSGLIDSGQGRTLGNRANVAVKERMKVANKTRSYSNSLIVSRFSSPKRKEPCWYPVELMREAKG